MITHGKRYNKYFKNDQNESNAHMQCVENYFILNPKRLYLTITHKLATKTTARMIRVYGSQAAFVLWIPKEKVKQLRVSLWSLSK